MMRQRRKSVVRPVRSVRRPSSKTCRKRSQTGAAAFSNSSSRMTENGSLRTDAISEAPVSSTLVSASSRSSASGVWNSLMSSRTSLATEPNMNSASVFASSVLPVPVGPTKRNTPSGRVGSVSPALTSAIRSTMTPTASSCPSTRSLKKPRTSSRSSGRLGVEQRERKSRKRRERREHVAGVERGRLPLDAASTVASSSRIAPPGCAMPGRNCCASSYVSWSTPRGRWKRPRRRARARARGSARSRPRSSAAAGGPGTPTARAGASPRASRSSTA